MCVRWVWTVRRLIPSRRAISRLVSDCDSRLITRRSVGDSARRRSSMRASSPARAPRGVVLTDALA
ncbi:MAG: hypothetical protein DWB43_00810 [Lautropia sp.]|nr:hypothetical protein [Lautropia sp.]RIK91248.1 MAG: hypothetical protein DCC70_01610 [Burkholderiales bacterium]